LPIELFHHSLYILTESGDFLALYRVVFDFNFNLFVVYEVALLDHNLLHVSTIMLTASLVDCFQYCV